MSAAKMLHIEVNPSGQSLIQIKNRIGPRTESCGTPAHIFSHEDVWPFKTTLC